MRPANQGQTQFPRGKIFFAAITILAAAICACHVGYLLGDDPNAPARKPAPPPQTSPVAQFLGGHDLLGRVVLIEFGLIGCELSEQGLDMMISLHNRKAIPALSYARVEATKDAGAVDAYYAKKKPPFPVFQDEGASVAKAFDATIYPRFVLVDRFGRIRYRGKQPSRSELSKWVEALKDEQTDLGPGVPLFGALKLDVPNLLLATKLPDLERVVRPLRAYRGEKGLMLIFVDTNCPFAGAAIGETPTVAAALGLQQVRTALVNLNDPANVVAEFYRTHWTGTPVVYDVGTGTQLRWNVDAVPTVVLISAADEIAYNGPAVWAEVGAAAATMLGLPVGSVQLGAQGTRQG